MFPPGGGNGAGPPSAAPARPPPEGLSPRDVHVLLVDDERLARMVVGSLLRKLEYRGEGGAGGAGGRASARAAGEWGPWWRNVGQGLVRARPAGRACSCLTAVLA
jgi:hypothetical protein